MAWNFQQSVAMRAVDNKLIKLLQNNFFQMSPSNSSYLGILKQYQNCNGNINCYNQCGLSKQCEFKNAFWIKKYTALYIIKSVQTRLVSAFSLSDSKLLILCQKKCHWVMHIKEKKCKVWNDFTQGISLVSDLMQNHLSSDNVFYITLSLASTKS